MRPWLTALAVLAGLQAGCDAKHSSFRITSKVPDDHLAVVGSINLDRLSLDLMEEGSLVLSDADVARRLEQDWEADLEFCKEMPRK